PGRAGLQQAFTRGPVGADRCGKAAGRGRAGGAVDARGETGYSLGLALALLPSGSRRLRVEAPVAQWIEYCPPKAGVAGSIPAGRTNECLKIKALLAPPNPTR